MLDAIILGLVQGLTEFIPVSSSGHLILMGEWLQFDGSLTFDIALNIGTLLALLIFFRRDFYELALALFKRQEKSRLAWLIVLGTIPAIILGVLLQDLAETTFRSEILVAVNLVVVALLMLIVDRYARHTLELKQLTVPRALGIGMAQSVALIPGISRSGATITTAMAMGFKGEAATRFSFLLSAPIIFGATLKVLLEGENMAQISATPAIFTAGIVAAFISGYLAIKFMLTYLARHGLSVFAYYRIGLAVVVLLLATVQ